MSYLTGIDVGTTGAKVVLISGSGEVVASVTEEYRCTLPHPNWAEQDTEGWWKATVASWWMPTAGTTTPTEGFQRHGSAH